MTFIVIYLSFFESSSRTLNTISLIPSFVPTTPVPSLCWRDLYSQPFLHCTFPCCTVCVGSDLSMKAWCSRKMGSLADPCTEDMEPFMKTCRALCMVLWPSTAMPVSASVKPAEWGKTVNGCHIICHCIPCNRNQFKAGVTFDGVSEAPVGEAVHWSRLVLGEAQHKFHIGCCRESAHAVGVVIAGVT